MNEPGYKSLISYKLSQIAFDIGWEFVPRYYGKYEDARQRDQIKQALRSLKQNITEGSSERSLSTKLKLYDVAKSSGMEAREDFEDILRHFGLQRWLKNDPRLFKLHTTFESIPSTSLSFPSLSLWIQKELGGKDRREGVETIVNYELDVLIRCGYLLDQQIRAVEELHKTTGGYNDLPAMLRPPAMLCRAMRAGKALQAGNLLKKRLEYRKKGNK